jgi:hypothetical protein
MIAVGAGRRSVRSAPCPANPAVRGDTPAPGAPPELDMACAEESELDCVAQVTRHDVLLLRGSHHVPGAVVVRPSRTLLHPLFPHSTSYSAESPASSS